MLRVFFLRVFLDVQEHETSMRGRALASFSIHIRRDWIPQRIKHALKYSERIIRNRGTIKARITFVQCTSSVCDVRTVVNV